MYCHWMKNLRLFAVLMMCVSAIPGNAQNLLDGIGADDPPVAEEAAPPAQDDFLNFGAEQRQVTPEEKQAFEKQVMALNDEAKALSEQGDVNAALAKYDEAIAMTSNFTSQFEKGMILRGQGYLREAIRAFTLATEFSNDMADKAMVRQNYIELGQSYLETEEYNTAMAVFEGALSLPGESRNAELFFNLGFAQAEFALNQQYQTAQTRQEDLQKALVSYDRAIAIDPNYAEALYERGTAHLLLGDREQAIEDLEQSVEFDPENSEAVAQFGFASLSRALSEGSRRNGQSAKIDADLKKALEQLTRYLTLVPETTEEEDEEDETEIQRENVLLQRSAAYIALGDEAQDGSYHYQNAIRDAEAVIELLPDSPDGYYQKGLAHRMLGDFEAAIAAFDETIEISPANPEALLRRGIVHFRRGDLQMAMSDFDKAVQYSGGINPRASFWLGLSHAKRGDHRLAVTTYTRAIRYQPFYTIAYFNRGLSYMKLGRYERARDDFNEVLGRDRDNSQARSMRDQAVQLIDSR